MGKNVRHLPLAWYVAKREWRLFLYMRFSKRVVCGNGALPHCLPIKIFIQVYAAGLAGFFFEMKTRWLSKKQHQVFFNRISSVSYVWFVDENAQNHNVFNVKNTHNSHRICLGCCAKLLQPSAFGIVYTSNSVYQWLFVRRLLCCCCSLRRLKDVRVLQLPKGKRTETMQQM